MTRRVPASIAELTQICRATPRRLALRISRPALKFKRLQCRGGENISFVSIDKRAGGGCGRGMTETFITYGDAELQAVKSPRSTDIRSLASPPADPLRFSRKRSILLPRIRCLARQTRISVEIKVEMTCAEPQSARGEFLDQQTPHRSFQCGDQAVLC